MSITTHNQGFLNISVAIVIASVFIAGAIIFSGGRESSSGKKLIASTGSAGNEQASAAIPQGNTSVRPITEDDHIRGNARAAITIVEYSDFECPFCSRFHPTLARITNDFPDDVRWVYRHFPLSQIHSRAREASIASECVASLAGNEAFWEFSDRLFANQQDLSASLYKQAAVDLGITEGAFEDCLSSPEASDAVDADLEDAIASGGRGTPHSVIIGPDGNGTPISGALPYEQIASFIQQIIQ
jgi:protein-disulfide isomerase